MPPTLDHVVMLCHGLNDAASQYQRLGFTVAPLMHHPFGTGNRLVMFRNDFIELMGIVRPEVLAGSGLRRQALLDAGHRGALDLCLLSHAIGEDHARLVQHGLADGDPYHVVRPVTLPDGRQTAAEFDVAWAQPPAPRIGILYCQQHVPEALWIREWQSHANGALGISGLSIVAEDPEAVAQRIAAVTGASIGSGSARDCILPLKNGAELRIMRAESYGDRHGGAMPQAFDTAKIAAVDIQVQSLDSCRRIFEANSVAFRPASAGLIVDAENAAGTSLRFCQQA